jgi:hypothetical protein
MMSYKNLMLWRQQASSHWECYSSAAATGSEKTQQAERALRYQSARMCIRQHNERTHIMITHSRVATMVAYIHVLAATWLRTSTS